MGDSSCYASVTPAPVTASRLSRTRYHLHSTRETFSLHPSSVRTRSHCLQWEIFRTLKIVISDTILFFWTVITSERPQVKHRQVAERSAAPLPSQLRCSVQQPVLPTKLRAQAFTALLTHSISRISLWEMLPFSLHRRHPHFGSMSIFWKLNSFTGIPGFSKHIFNRELLYRNWLLKPLDTPIIL